VAKGAASVRRDRRRCSGRPAGRHCGTSPSSVNPPTYSSWVNQVERFFSLIIDKATGRGSFTSVKQLVQRIDHFVTALDVTRKPFTWTVTPDSTQRDRIDFARISCSTARCATRDA